MMVISIYIYYQTVEINIILLNKQGFYKGTYNSLNKCLSCHLSCKTCYGPLDNNCLSCETNFYDLLS